MTRLPVIVGFGGYNAAGRSSFHHGFRRMVLDSLPEHEQQETLLGLATLMKLVSFDGAEYVDKDGKTYTAEAVVDTYREVILEGTLVRRFGHADQPEYTDAWYEKIAVKSAGQLPTGFHPGEYYRSQFHPKGLQMTILAASDAVKSIGIPWQQILDQIDPDQVAVYAGSSMSQMDDHGFRGLMQSRLSGQRISTKQLALGLSSMPADFINAYVLGSVGSTGSTTGACATFLYNLRQGVEDIQSGRRRVVVLGNSEAPLTPEIIDGYAAMGALATDANLRKLTPEGEPDYRRASRPFGENCGFTLAESAQYVVLMDDELAVSLGACIHGAVTDVFINADGFKRSISAPGAGNYISLAKAVASARSLLGDESIRERSWILAHGSSTPQNRVTESTLMDRVAQTFGIERWPVSAIKSYVGHPLAPASGDQLVASLGAFKYGILPGIKTIDRVAEDVVNGRLQIPTSDQKTAAMDVAFINTKGFGGNNASAVVVSPTVVETMLEKRYGKRAMLAYRDKRDATQLAAIEYDMQAIQGKLNPIYQFGVGLIDEEALNVGSEEMTIPGFSQSIKLRLENKYADMV